MTRAIQREATCNCAADNAAAVLWIDTGEVEGRLVAVDGQDVEPRRGQRFGFARGQRLDIELDRPVVLRRVRELRQPLFSM